MSVLTEPSRQVAAEPRRRRFAAWPLFGAAAGLLGAVATFSDSRAGDTADRDYTVTVADMPDVDFGVMRFGGLVGYLAVAMMLVFAAVWYRRVVQRFGWSMGAPVVLFGLVASAATLTFAYGWKGAIGNYAHGASEAGTYDDAGLYVYYVLNDFGPFIAWLPVLVALGALAWMAYAERLVSRALGAVAGAVALLTFLAVAVTGVPGLPFTASIGLTVAGVWLAVGRSHVTREVL